MERCTLCWQQDGSCEECKKAFESQYGFKQITNVVTGIKNVTPALKKVIENMIENKPAPTKVYLAIPYTWNATESYRIANRVAAKLMNEGYIVFSPISHSHVIADYLHPDLRYSQTFWMNQDLPFIPICDEVHVVCIGEYGMDLIEQSKGCQDELKKAEELKKPIKIIEYYE